MATKKSIVMELDVDYRSDGTIYQTVNTTRFKERGDREDQAMGKAYIKTARLEHLGSPKAVRITIEPLS